MINDSGSKRKDKKAINSSNRYPRSFNGNVETLSKLSIKNIKPQSLLDSPEFKLSLVIPAYNEEKRLDHMLKDTIKILKSKVSSDSEFNCEVILVDDGSKDGTIDEYRKIVSKLNSNSRIIFKLLKLEINSGKGRAVSEVTQKQVLNLMNDFYSGHLGIFGREYSFC